MATPPLQLQVGLPAPAFSTTSAPGDANTQQEKKNREEIQRLRSQHDLYKIYGPEWDLYLSAFEGGADMANEKHLFKHQRENQEDFLDRVKRVHYLNYCDVLVKFFTRFIFTETIQRDGGKKSAEWYEQFIQNVNRKGATINEYMSDVSDDFQVFGMCYDMVEMQPKPAGVDVLTKQTEKDLGLEPYWVHIQPDEVLDWVVDDYEKFVYLKRKQIVERMGSQRGVKEIIERYTEYYTGGDIEISEIDITDQRNPEYLGKTDSHDTLGEIPIVLTRYERSKRYSFMGNSMLRDFAYNNRAIMNLTSLIDEFDYRQCFNILAKQVENSIPMASQEEGVQSSSNVMEVPKGAEMPQYLSPPADPAKFLQSERDYIKNEMFRRAAQDTLNELFNGEGRSGFSQAQSFSKTVPFIATRADTLERTEIRLMQLTMKRKGFDWAGKIKYKDRYELTSLTDEITQLTMLARDLQIGSETFIKSELKRFVEVYDGKLKQDPQMLKKIMDEIDAINIAAWNETQKEALIGLPKTPAGQNKPKSSGTMSEVAAESKTSSSGSTNKPQ